MYPVFIIDGAELIPNKPQLTADIKLFKLK